MTAVAPDAVELRDWLFGRALPLWWRVGADRTRGGFLPGRDGRLPQSANPHMHLLEAALAWMELDSSPPWRTMAEGIVALCLEKMIEPRTGALREFFTADWMTAPGVGGATCDPGH